MNKRIRELALQAGGIYHNDDGDELTPALVGKGVEKFAELIVKECVNISIDQKKWVEDMAPISEQDKSWNQARIQQSQRIIDKIREHFGVEE